MQTQENVVREWAIRRAREYQWLFAQMIVPRRWWYRWLLGGAGEADRLSLAGQRVLADLRDFSGATSTTIFDPDPLEMARMAGRREVFMRISYFLDLDESKVRKLMEIDDGIGE
jgi:hypothetical protein